jgi:hypothetical protein
MTAQRLRLSVILSGLLLSGLTLIAWTQPWVTVVVTGGPTLAVGGDIAAPALSTLSLAGLALVAALTVAGRIFRVVLGVLEAFLGGLIAYSGITALADPVVAAAPSITEVTGISGVESIRALVSSSAVTAWPAICVVLGLLLVGLAATLIATTKKWPVSGRKYQAVRIEPDGGDRSSVESWDALSGGNDPT